MTNRRSHIFLVRNQRKFIRDQEIVRLNNYFTEIKGQRLPECDKYFFQASQHLFYLNKHLSNIIINLISIYIFFWVESSSNIFLIVPIRPLTRAIRFPARLPLSSPCLPVFQAIRLTDLLRTKIVKPLNAACRDGALNPYD